MIPSIGGNLRFSYSAPAISSISANGRNGGVTASDEGIFRLPSPHLFADVLGERSVTTTGRSFGGSAGDIRVVVGGQDNGGGVAALRGVGLQGHRTLVFILPYMNLKDFLGGVFLLQSVRVVLDGRSSRPVTEAISFSMPSLLFHLKLDCNYDKIRKF